MTTISDSPRAFLPGMGVDWLLPLYDPLTRLLGLDAARRALLTGTRLESGQRVLDVGCGTGSLAVIIKQTYPKVDVVGLDPDERALARARRKASRAGVAITFDHGFSDALRYPPASFDRVVSSFMFHHLERDAKLATLREVGRVLKADGRLHLLDFGGPEDSESHTRFRLHAHPRLHDNATQTVAALMKEAGLADVSVHDRRSLFGGAIRIAYYEARVSSNSAASDREEAAP